MEHLLEKHSGELLILILSALLLGSLLILVPQLLRSHYHARELQHAENMRALEKGHLLPPADKRTSAAGRTAALVPIFAVCTAGVVTCFLISFKSEHVFAVTLAVWCVAGVVGLAAITGGVALMGRLAQLSSGEEEEETEEDPLEEDVMR